MTPGRHQRLVLKGMFCQLLSRCSQEDPSRSYQHGKRNVAENEERKSGRSNKQNMDKLRKEQGCMACKGTYNNKKKCWQIFVDDRLVPKDVTDLQANAQPKAEFSSALTVMDKICGWGEDENGCDIYLQPVCGSTPNACCVMDRKPHRTS